MDKRGMQLAVNTLIVLILGVVMISGGIYFLQQIMSSSTNIIDSVSKENSAEVGRLLTSGDMVAISFPTRSDARVEIPEDFGLGIKNIYEQTYKFAPKVTLKEAMDPEGLTMSPVPSIDDILFMRDYTNLDAIELEPHERVTDIPFALTIPEGSGKGIYVFEVSVYTNATSGCESFYGTPTCVYDTKIVRITI